MISLIQSLRKHKGALPMSWSRIQCLLRCPRQFDLQYRQRIPASAEPADPAALEAGKLIHRALELSMDRCSSFGYEYKNSGYEHMWASVYKSAVYEESRKKLELLREPTAHVLAAILGAAKRSGATVRAERKLMLDMAWRYSNNCSWSNMAWLGYVDVEMTSKEKCVIIDYKSEHYTEERAESTKLQTAMYANAVFLREPGVQQVQTGCAYLLDSRIEMTDTVRREEHGEICSKLRSLVESYLAALESGDTEPRTSQYCKWCGFINTCTATDKER